MASKGFGFDMNVACSSATFAIQLAADMIRAGSARAILVVNPEICSAHLEWRDRDCHFIFGDVCTAIVLERDGKASSADQYEVLSTKLVTEFSNNIRNNNGFLRRTREGGMTDRRDMLFRQEGRKVFKQVVPMVAELIQSHLAAEGLGPAESRASLASSSQQRHERPDRRPRAGQNAGAGRAAEHFAGLCEHQLSGQHYRVFAVFG